MEILALILAFLLGLEEFTVEFAETGLRWVAWVMTVVLAVVLARFAYPWLGQKRK